MATGEHGMVKTARPSRPPKVSPWPTRNTAMPSALATPTSAVAHSRTCGGQGPASQGGGAGGARPPLGGGTSNPLQQPPAAAHSRT
jgi:hypothetical protein